MNSHQLVIRCDTANGYYKVGWSSELPLGRFQHIELVTESETLSVLNSKNPLYSMYVAACTRVSNLNASLIKTEKTDKNALGWLPVYLALNDDSVEVVPDEFGCFNAIALKTRYRLSKNSNEVWAVIHNSAVLQVESRYPRNKLAELQYQIWKHHKLDKLSEFGGEIVQGKLLVSFSGLWFVENNNA